MNNIKIIFEDDYLIVLDKPAKVTVNRSETTKSDTVQDWLIKKFSIFNFSPRGEAGQFSKETESDFIKRSGIVHRIDKETSGLLIIAKNKESFEKLQDQFKKRLVKKVYLALVHGKLTGEGEINIPVGRLPWNRTRFGVLAGGREAVTRYRVISNVKYPAKGEARQRRQISNKQEDLTLLKLYPETGRTHQIRVHLKYINHPIFSDDFYAGRKTARNDRKILPRLFLHASKISFMHPKTKENLSFESDLPKELKDLVY